MTIFRKATGTDLPAVARMRWDWIITERGDTPSQDYCDFEIAYVHWAQERASSYHCYVIDRGGQLLGMAWVAYHARVPSPAAFDRATADLQSIYVVPHERNSGLGGELIEFVTQGAFETGVERVTVHSSDESVSAYERAGFEMADVLRLRKPDL